MPLPPELEDLLPAGFEATKDIGVNGPNDLEGPRIRRVAECFPGGLQAGDGLKGCLG
ncbi:MAG: hypothetical protein ACK4OK_09165 [Thermoflexus sp.]